MYEGFEPLTVSSDIIDTHLIRFINLVLDNTGPEEDFRQNIGNWGIRFLGEWIDELQDGFSNGLQDTLQFF